MEKPTAHANSIGEKCDANYCENAGAEHQLKIHKKRVEVALGLQQPQINGKIESPDHNYCNPHKVCEVEWPLNESGTALDYGRPIAERYNTAVALE